MPMGKSGFRRLLMVLGILIIGLDHQESRGGH
jgi:hypothetical protein